MYRIRNWLRRTFMPDYFLAILYDLFLFWEKNGPANCAENYQEYIYQVYLSVNKLNNTLFIQGAEIMGGKDFLTKETFFRLLLQYLNALSVSFEGEPLSGLQIMGILETRSLDFKNVILLSVNEGIMPKANVSGSFIPYHLRRGVGLPTVEEQNAMYAYYFYRLLQRAESVIFVYNSGSNGLRTGEKSRFLYQLLLESPFDIVESAIENTIDPAAVYPIMIEKKGKVLEILNGFIESGRRMSPTALDQYVQCPLSYYFKYIAHFEEEEEVSEEVNARLFGTIFHAVMEAVYSPVLNKTVDADMITEIIDNEPGIDLMLSEAFYKHFFKSTTNSDRPQIAGRNKLIFEVIKKMVFQTLAVDLTRTPFYVRGLELQTETMIPVFQGTKAIRTGGVIDRIDLKSGVLEILDYKTGKADHALDSIEELFDLAANKRNKAAFQTLIYCYVWDKMFPGNENIYPGIYGLKEIFKEKQIRLNLKGQGEVNFQEVKIEFEQRLIHLLEEIFDPEIPFTQTTVEEHCQYCNFLAICGKQATPA
jgi:PD-(D/E)XK nuclease superfamily